MCLQRSSSTEDQEGKRSGAIRCVDGGHLHFATNKTFTPENDAVAVLQSADGDHGRCGEL